MKTVLRILGLLILTLPPSPVLAKQYKVYPVGPDFYAILQKTLASRLDRTREMLRRQTAKPLTQDDCREINAEYALLALNTPKFDAESALVTGYQIFGNAFLTSTVYFEADYNANQEGRPLSEPQKMKRYRGNSQLMKRLRKSLVHDANIDLVLGLASGGNADAVRHAIERSPLAPSFALRDEQGAVQKKLPFICNDDGSLAKNQSYQAETDTQKEADEGNLAKNAGVSSRDATIEPAESAPGTPEPGPASQSAATTDVGPVVSISPPIGLPDPLEKQLHASLSAAMKQRGFAVAAAGATSTLKLHGYLVARLKDGKVVIDSVWDLNDVTGKRLHRYTASHDQNGAGTGDVWSVVTQQTLDGIGGDASVALCKFVKGDSASECRS